MDSEVKKALEAVYKERDRLIQAGSSVWPLKSEPVPMVLPRRNFKQKLQKALASPHRWQLILDFVAVLVGRVKILRLIAVFFMFPSEIIRLQKKIESLEFEQADLKVKLLEMTKTSKNRL